MAFLRNLKLLHKLSLAFGLMVLIILGVGLKAVFTIQSMDQDFTNFAKHGDALTAATHITRGFMDLRAKSIAYVEHSSEEAFQKALSSKDALLKMVEKELKIVEFEEERVRLLDVERLVGDYWIGFEKIVKDRHEEEAVIDNELHDTGNLLQAEILEISKHLRKEELKRANLQPDPVVELISDAVIHILIARDHANRFVYGGIKGELEYAQSELDRVQKDLEQAKTGDLSAADRKLADDALKHLDDYRKALDHYIGLEQDIRSLETNVIQQTSAKILKDLDEIEAIALEAEHKISEHAHDAAAQSVMLSTMALFGGVLIGIVLSVVLGRAISKPIQTLAENMRTLSTGRLDIDVPEARGNDEIGEMTKAFAVFHGNMVDRAKIQKEQAGDRDRDQRRQDELNQLVGIFANTIQGVFSKVSSSSQEMASTATHLLDNATATSEQSDLLNRESNETASIVTTVSSAAEELTASIQEIQRRVEHSASISDKAISLAQSTKENFADLLNAAGQITSVVDLIKDIAEQTNLLALNATIEAARAGEAGRGFAVVANEVKELATQTAKATGEIGDQVGAVQRTARDAEEALSAINGTISEIHEVSSSITAAVTQQQGATQEIAQSVEVVASSAGRVSESVNVVRQSADKGHESARDVQEAAHTVSHEAEILSSEVSTFLGALENREDGDTYKILPVNLSATITVEGVSHKARVKRISAAAAWIDTPVNATPGSTLVIEIEELGEPITARLSGNDETGSQIQFPLNLQHISKMREQLMFLEQGIAA